MLSLEELKEKYSYNHSTPVMQQYLNLKFAHPQCLLLFRMGDFYELFYEDAVNASAVLGITLTKRGGVEMCGVPYHALDNYLPKLVEENYKVAVCEQLESPEDAKKRGGYKAVVTRDVVRIITPGTILEDHLISPTTPNYLISIVLEKDKAAICFADISNAEIGLLEFSAENLLSHITRLNPKEILLSENLRGHEQAINISQAGFRITFQVASFFAENKSKNAILRFYDIAGIEGIGDLSNIQVRSLGSLLEYLSLTQKQSIPLFELPKIISLNNLINIDPTAMRNLEITSSQSGRRQGSLLDAIDQTVTKQGSRLLHKFVSSPLRDIAAINDRLQITEFFFENNAIIDPIRKLLQKAGDLDRALSRISAARSSPRDLLIIYYTQEVALEIKGTFFNYHGLDIPSFLDPYLNPLSGDEEIGQLIKEAIREEPAVNLSEGGVIKPEYHPKLADLDNLIKNGKDIIEKLKEKYKAETGVENLKINHNNVLGLFIEVTSKNSSKITDPKFIHRQTTIGSARFTTQELQKLESDMVSAQSLKINLEKEIYEEICRQINAKFFVLKKLAESLSFLDVFTNLAYIALEHNYTKPILTLEYDFIIEEGRHPVVEKVSREQKTSFISNNCSLSEAQRIWLLTGPNMSGKSTFLRQNALIAIMAHIGSFVPAAYAKIGIIDKIFSRIGAGDDLLKNQSTFMIEMLETSMILAQSSDRSLLILDEIGRGTSTYDGVAIAWSVLEYIHDKIRSRCLFATHYHELTALSNFLPSLENYTVAIEEDEGNILFLHKIIKGAADKSYGIHVAKLAGLPKTIITRANEILTKLEKVSDKRNKVILKTETPNLSLF